MGWLYIAQFAPEIQERLQAIRKLYKELMPGAKEVISYGIPAYRITDKGYSVIYFAGHAKHIGIYPLPDKLPERLEPNRAGKGTLRFPHDRPLPLGLIKQVIEARLKELP